MVLICGLYCEYLALSSELFVIVVNILVSSSVSFPNLFIIGYAETKLDKRAQI